MPCVSNGLYIVQGEVAILLAAMRRGSRWSSHSMQDYNQDVLVQSFNDLKEALNQLRDLKDLDPSHYFGPFLEVIRAGGTTGPVTSIALSAVHKFLSYGLIASTCKTASGTLDNIADAVTHTKFVSTDQNSDGVVLLKILQVLRAIVLSPLGAMLTHESMCEIMLSCFRICFEHRLIEHIRKSAEFCLKDIVQHLFTRLPEFAEDDSMSSHVRKIKMNKSPSESSSKSKKKYIVMDDEKTMNGKQNGLAKLEEVPAAANIVDMQGEIHQDVQMEAETPEEATKPLLAEELSTTSEKTDPSEASKDDENPQPTTEQAPAASSPTVPPLEYVNPQGVRFTAALPSSEPDSDGASRLVPYGLSWVRELFRFLVSLCNPLDKMNTDIMVNVGLTLVEVALEVGADALGRYNSLLGLARDELCRNLFSVLQTDRLSIFALDIQVCFLLFEALRTHLKFQLESYLGRLTDIIVSDSMKVSFEQKEIALEAVVQLWRVPGLVTELYLNYDCDLYCPNLFEDITKLLSKNAFPVTDIYSTHLLSLDALLAIIDTVEKHCHNRILNERQAVDHNAICKYKDARHPVSLTIPSHEQLMAIKRKKKLLISGTEQFNVKPKKGIKFLQDHHLLKPQLDPQEVVHFLRENPGLDKKMIGDYISERSNIDVLGAFVKSFDFSELRIDEALRMYLEAFRLPGESPLIAIIMEFFAEHWHKSNGEPFANADAAFTLAYAVIMLNVDQHNHNVKRQNNPMTPSGFKKNLKAVNGGQDFDQDMLDEIYNAIKNDEIVMPAEQTGLVKENYLWKVLLRRGAGKDGIYIHAPEGLYDHDLFSLIWAPTNAALSFVFDKSTDPTIYRKAISGFRKCAMISAHYGMSNDFDNLIGTLSKFSTLTTSSDLPDQLTVAFGSNAKAQLAAQTLFHLVHRHGDILREGWSTLLELILVLYRCQLLPTCLVEAEDFLEAGGKIQLVREEVPAQKAETGLLSSLYSYIALGEGGRTPGPEEQESMRVARECIQDCRVESVVTESKFLREDALVELVKALIAASPEPSSTTRANTDTAVFLLEMLIKVVTPNRDRAECLWPLVRDHLYSVMMGGSACENHFLTERAIVGLLRLAIHMMRREDLSGLMLQSLRMLLLLKPATLQRVARQIAYGLNELIKTSAANIHTTTDWTIIFTLLECVGAGSPPPRLVGDTCDQGSAVPWAFAPPLPRYKPPKEVGAETKSDGDMHSGTEDSGLGVERGYTSEPEPSRGDATRPTTGGWILVGRAGELQPLHPRGLAHFDLGVELQSHDPFALVKCCETLAFLVRDVAHITPFNYRVGVQCIRIFVEASLNGVNKKLLKKSSAVKDGKGRKKGPKRREGRSPQLSPTVGYDADESDPEEAPSGYHQITIQLLDLMHTLHTRTAQIHRWWAEEGEARPEAGSLWQHGWCPLLQGIARLCGDTRKQVRMTAITYLQRALLVHDLQTLTADEWESCFTDVLFPLLTKLLELEVPDELHLEETRVRAATVLSKVFLHHLTPLLSLPSFTTLWLGILDLMDTYMHVEKSDLLLEAIPESLKNMLLVMDSAQIFRTSDGYLPLWDVTWNRIAFFLPGLKEEFFKAQSSVPKLDDHVAGIAAPLPHQLPQDPAGSPPTHAPVPINVPIYPGVPGRDEAEAGLEERAETSAEAASQHRGTSIILQPPSYGQTYTTPIFNHAGQQMMTTVLAANPVPLVLQSDPSQFSFPLPSAPHVPQPEALTQYPLQLASIPQAPQADPTRHPVSIHQTEQSPSYPVPVAPLPRVVQAESPTYSIPIVGSVPQQMAGSPPFAPSSPSIFGSHPSAFVPYVSANAADSPSSQASPEHAPADNLDSLQSSPEKTIYSPEPSTDSVLDFDFVPHYSKPEPSTLADNSNQFAPPPFSQPESSFTSQPAPLDNAPSFLEKQVDNSLSRLLDNAPLFIPAPSNITAPVQMFSGSRVVPGTARLASLVRPLNNNDDEPVSAASALSQYFNASFQNQQHEAFDQLVASGGQSEKPTLE